MIFTSTISRSEQLQEPIFALTTVKPAKWNVCGLPRRGCGPAPRWRWQMGRCEMSSAPKWTPLERHNARCGTEFCALHKAAPRMAEALHAALRLIESHRAWDTASGKAIGPTTAGMTVVAIRAA